MEASTTGCRRWLGKRLGPVFVDFSPIGYQSNENSNGVVFGGCGGSDSGNSGCLAIIPGQTQTLWATGTFTRRTK